MSETFGPRPDQQAGAYAPSEPSDRELPVACPFVKGDTGQDLPCVGSVPGGRCRVFKLLNTPDGPSRVTKGMKPQCARVRAGR